ncbi:hypothetical protein [Geminisphaera colitermitum]|uniref:hypothetical protein n=1 Tax=Geminisphaera colitermitum TaxID=1148786 RepID=UPI0012FED131|nr:hypothetical protein [Geminisphaera colitermitum]
MSNVSTPKPYEEWRITQGDRAEDAAYVFGYYFMRHCRAEALKIAASKPLPTTQEAYDTTVSEAVDTALHNVMDLLEGFWRTEAGPNHTAEFALAVRVCDRERKILERIDISPCLLDLPIGFWKWRGGEFR